MRDRSIVDSTRKDLSGSGLSRRQSAINSTAKYREKKKNELGNLEQDVRELQNEMEQLQKNINNMKKKITVTIETLTKVVHILIYRINWGQMRMWRYIMRCRFYQGNQMKRWRFRQYSRYLVILVNLIYYWIL